MKFEGLLPQNVNSNLRVPRRLNKMQDMQLGTSRSGEKAKTSGSHVNYGTPITKLQIWSRKIITSQQWTIGACKVLFKCCKNFCNQPKVGLRPAGGSYVIHVLILSMCLSNTCSEKHTWQTQPRYERDLYICVISDISFILVYISIKKGLQPFGVRRGGGKKGTVYLVFSAKFFFHS